MADVITPSLRERHKREKFEAIRDAAQRLFVTKGFDNTTTREIAKLADVGIGTVFSYAADKRDLLFLIVNDDVVQAIDSGREKAEGENELADAVVACFSQLYVMLERDPPLSRLMVKEFNFRDFNSLGPHTRRFELIRRALIENVSAVVKRAFAAGEIHSREDADFIGITLFSIYQSEIRRWLMNDFPEANDGIRSLHRAVNLLINGLQPKKERQS